LKRLTVKELIEELQNYEENKHVWILSEGLYTPVTSVDQKEVENDDDIVIS
jgi:hypothetical protein